MKKKVSHLGIFLLLICGLVVSSFLTPSQIGFAADLKLSPSTPVSSDNNINKIILQNKNKLTNKDQFVSPGYEGVNTKLNPLRDMGIKGIIGPDNRVRINNTTVYPYRAVVQIESDIRSCTGWLIGPDSVATAGHCVYDFNTKKWASHAVVTPGSNGASKPYGSINAKSFHSVAGWTNDGSANFNYGVIRLASPIGNTVGWFGYRWTPGSLNGVQVNLAGYPADKPLWTLWQDQDQIRITEPYAILYRNDTTSGNGGSPLYQSSFYGCGACVLGLHTYAYGGSLNKGTRITKDVFYNLLNWTDF